MASEITMPKLSDTMTEGLFAGWKKNIGDRIERGDIIAEVETDKAVMDLEAFTAGILIKTMVHGGEHVRVGTVLGLIGETAEMVAAVAAPLSITPEETSPEAATAPHGNIPAVEHRAAGAFNAQLPHEKASPLVRRLAREQGFDLERIKGSGPEGRITQEDLVAFARQQQKSAPVVSFSPITTAVQAEPPAEAETTPMRQAIAATVTKSWQTIPHFSVTIEINMGACHEIVRELKEGPDAIGFNAIVIKACAHTLADFPLLRSSDSVASNDINISFAVATPDGLLMPVIRQCRRLSVMEIERETSRLAERSRVGHLSAEEMAGGAFSVSNLGMYGVDVFNALILPGQTAILAVGTVRERPLVLNGQLAVAPTMMVTLSSDHRSVYGAYAASFLAQLRSVLEKPAMLLL